MVSGADERAELIAHRFSSNASLWRCYASTFGEFYMKLAYSGGFKVLIEDGNQDW